jgi:hypothetical protein
MAMKNNIRPNNTYRKEEDLDIDIEGIKVKRLPPVASINYINLTPDFYSRNKEDQLVFLWSLCSSMNYALDVMQKERNQVLEEILPQKEALVIALQAQNDKQTQIMQQQMVSENAKSQARASELYDVKAAHRKEIAALKAEIKSLKG